MGVYRKAQRGSARDRSARRENDLTDAANALKRSQRGIRPGSLRPPSGTLAARNDSGAALSFGAVVHVTGCVVTPTTDAGVVYDRPILTVTAPATANIGTGVVGVVLEPIASGAVGTITIDGVCFAQVNVTDANHKYAVEVNADTEKFASASSGNVRIIYKPAGTGQSWCIVRLGASGAVSTWAWAKVTAVGTSTFSAKLVDNSGNVYGDTLTVNVAACVMDNVTTTPTLSTELPWIKAGVELMIEQRTGRRPGWWLVGHNVTTCAG